AQNLAAVLATKLVLGGGSVFLAHDQGLLGDTEQGAAVLHRVLGALPPAVEEWAKYLRLQLPAVPNVNFSLCEAWNSGVQKSSSALSMAPAKSYEYVCKGWLYIKNLAKGEH
uniref:MICOS complex subunit MIC13 n=1 Tax=Callorhinchus milii TaxID=7868 RepID=A0A4W3GRP0_CALMI